MRSIVKIVFLLFVMGIEMLVPRNSYSSDFENWTFIGGRTNIGQSEFSFHSANFFRAGSDYFLNHTQLSLDFPSQHAFSFGIGYKQEYVEFPNHWRAEYRPMLHLYYQKTLGNFVFRDRSRWEFRFFDGELINRYRNQIQLSYSNFEKFTPFVSTEFSFYFNEYNYSRQRTILGANVPLKKINLSIWTAHQINEDLPRQWSSKFILGTGVFYNF